MVGAGHGGGAARGQRLRGGLVRGDAPAARRRLVHGAPHEGVAEAEAPRDVRVADDVPAQQLVEGLERGRLGHARGGRGELELEGIAGHGGALEHAAGGGGEQGELPGERRGHAPRHLEVAEGELRCPRALARRPRRRPGELLEVEGVAAALLVERGGRLAVHAVAQQLARLRLAQGPELEPGQTAGAMGALERTRQPLGQLPRAHGDGDQRRRGGRTAQERVEQLDRAGVRPVRVVEQEHDRRRIRQDLDEPSDRPVRPVAPVGRRRCGAGGRERRQHVPQLCHGVVGQPVAPRRLERPDVVVQRVDEQPERNLTLELGCAAAEHEVAAGIRARRELGQHAALADPGLADDLERAGPPAAELVEGPLQTLDGGAAPDQLRGGLGHRRVLAARITAARWFRVPDQGAPRMSGAASAGRLVRCRASSSSTVMRPTSAARCSPRSGASRAPCATADALASCATGGHRIWWAVEAADDEGALAHVPFYVAERATATRVDEVRIP